MITTTPSVATMKLSKADYITLCDRFRGKALQEHQDRLTWMNRCMTAEAELSALKATP